jgi:hypothetical protein
MRFGRRSLAEIVDGVGAQPRGLRQAPCDGYCPNFAVTEASPP